MEKRLEKRLKKLKDKLGMLLNSEAVDFEGLMEATFRGVYAVYGKKEGLIYIGETGKTIHNRLKTLPRNLKHTLKRKVFIREINRKYNKDFKRSMKKKELKSKLKQEFKQEKIEEIKKEVNNYIEENFRIKFIEVEDKDKRISLEHFGIAVLNPKFND